MSFFRNENSVYAVRTFADDFIISEFNTNITSDADLMSKVIEYLRKEKLKVKLANDVTRELLDNNQTRLRYSFD